MSCPMPDMQSGPADVDLGIDRVGVRNVKLPLVVRDRAAGQQTTVAVADLSVDLPGHFKGTHMSRFVEAVEAFDHVLDYSSFKRLHAEVLSRLQAKRAHVIFRFPYFLQRSSPATGASGQMHYDCTLEGAYTDDHLTLTVGVEVPVMTVCPCSLAICEERAAHSQRALVRIQCRFSGFLWLEDLIAIAESSGSSPVYPLIKRADEKRVTEDAFANPTFVEDVVRNAAHALSKLSNIDWYRVEVESQESIHQHNAYATIRSA